MESRESVVAFLRKLTDKELVEVVSEAVAGRSPHDRKGRTRHFVVAEAMLDDGHWNVCVIGREDPERYPADRVSLIGEVFPDLPIVERGICGTCGSQVRSWAKQMVCPVCAAKVHP